MNLETRVKMWRTTAIVLFLGGTVQWCAQMVKAQTSDVGPPMVFSPDGKYLGDLDGNQYNRNSINNEYGKYGNPYGDTVKNPYGRYGSPYSPQSPNFEYGRGNQNRR